MKKTYLCTFVFLVFILFVQFIPAVAGGILEQNGYEMYIGKSKSLVKLISPDYVDAGNNIYLVDYTEDSKNNEIYLFTEFDQNDIVKAVGVIIGDYGSMITSGDPVEGLSAGLKVLGIDAHSVTDLSDNGNVITITTSNNITCYSQKEAGNGGQRIYTTYCESGSGGNKSGASGSKKENEIIMGCFEQDNNFRNDCEPIEWIIIAKKNDRALLISKYALETMPYAPKDASSRWDTSTIREWLNTDFLEDAFTQDEREKIITVTNKNPRNPEHNTSVRDGSKLSDYPDTEDTIFLLSIQELEKYFSSDEMRQCKLTPYVFSQMTLGMYKEEHCYWWTRTPGYLYGYATWVNPSGSIYYDGLDADMDSHGVRPAMWIDLSTIE